MKKGDVINGFRVIRDPGPGGGRSMWSFARKAGKTYFIKEYLSPKYIEDDIRISPVIKRRRRLECRKFEARQIKIINSLKENVHGGGNLITSIDFFRFGSKYYKITEKIKVVSLKPSDIFYLKRENQLILLRTIVHSLKQLHSAKIVHGDLKPDNILIKKTATGDFTTKLIDFDDSYFSGKPPQNRDELVGDFPYFSPEASRYSSGDLDVKPGDLTVKSDIFSLGLVFTQFLTGGLPHFDKDKYDYPCEAVNDGFQLNLIHPHLQPDLSSLINEMLAANPSARPSIGVISWRLTKIKILDKLSIVTRPKSVRPETKDTKRLHISKTAKPPNKASPKLRGRLLKL